MTTTDKMWMWMHGWRSELQTCQTSPSSTRWLRNHRLHHLSRGKGIGETSDQTTTTINSEKQHSNTNFRANPIYDTRVKTSDLRSRLMQHRPRRWTGSHSLRYYSRLQKTTADKFSTADNRNLRNNLNYYEMTITIMVWI